MEEDRAHAMKMPELLVYARTFAIGLIAAEIFRLTYLGGTRFAELLTDVSPCWRAAAVTLASLVCIAYVVAREGYRQAKRLWLSQRVDLLVAFAIGAWADELVVPWLERLHKVADGANPYWPPTLLALLLLVMGSSLWRRYRPRRKTQPPQIYFLTDDEISEEDEDILGNASQAKSFAESVLASGSHAGIVFGVDAPWGTGKTSFMNLAERQWRASASQVVVFRFEPLRYASEPDLADKFIRDLSTAIQRDVFIPEFRPAASRYSRMLKGKTEFSFLGMKFSLESSDETVDELLDAIDEVLKRNRRRVIVVVDDLDRLEAKAVNNVLFIARRTFKLTQAAYVLCYDTENLVAGKEEGERARQFLEKFVNVKLSLFVDAAMLRDFLLIDWENEAKKFPSVPSDTMLKLLAIRSELAGILADKDAASYLPLIGDLRKIKRFINAVLLMQLEKTDLGRTDFNRRDLINLILLHLHYPGTFRRIYAEETEGRTGSFAVGRNTSGGSTTFVNSTGLEGAIAACNGGADAFLLRQLFDVDRVGLSDMSRVDEATLTSRACFNTSTNRNLEKFLKLIVRFATPEPQETFKMYQEVVGRVTGDGEPISKVLSEPAFDLSKGEIAHDQFWRILLSQSYDFVSTTADDAIDTIVNYLPRYSLVEVDGRGLRARSVYTLILLLDRAGWGRTRGKRRANTPENIVEVARRIFGEGEYEGRGLIKRLTDPERGALGWYDMMLFRLQCSADRGGQAFNLQNALIVHDDPSGPTTGDTRMLATAGMRTISQRIFARFEEEFIKPKKNFVAAVETTPDAEFFGEAEGQIKRDASGSPADIQRLEHTFLGTRTATKSFVVYQLTNSKPATGSGVGCGFYDPSGTGDAGGIAAAMNQYLFGVCFNPELDPQNVFRFADFCLNRLVSADWAGANEEGYIPTLTSLTEDLGQKELLAYWKTFASLIKERTLAEKDRRVLTLNYIASYGQDLLRVFAVLDSALAGQVGNDATEGPQG